MKTSVFIVRAENGGTPENYLCGVYPTKELAEARVEELECHEDYEFEYAWVDEVKVSEIGADCFISNR